jgi:DNA primase
MFNDSHTAAETIREVVKPLALINDELKRNLLIKNIARKFNLREKLLEAEFDKVIKRSSSQRSTEIRTTTKEKAESTISEEITEQKKANPVIYNLEKDIIKLLFEGNSSILNFIHNNIKAEDFAIKIHMRLAKVVYEEIKHEKQIDADKLIEDIKNDELQSYVREIVFEKHSISSNWEERNPGVTPEQLLQKYTKDIVLSFKLHKIDKQIKENHNKIENTELEEDTLKLMSANRELAREKDRLREKFSEIEIE